MGFMDKLKSKFKQNEETEEVSTKWKKHGIRFLEKSMI